MPGPRVCLMRLPRFRNTCCYTRFGGKWWRRRQWVRSTAVLSPHYAQGTRTLCWEVGAPVTCFNSRLAQGILKGSFSNQWYKIIKLKLERVSFISPGLSLASRFIALYARTGVIHTGENEVRFPSTTQINAVLLSENALSLAKGKWKWFGLFWSCFKAVIFKTSVNG